MPELPALPCYPCPHQSACCAYGVTLSDAEAAEITREQGAGMAGDGELSLHASETGADGTTAVSWELGDQVGVQKVTAAMPGITGSPVTFTAVVLF